MVFVGVVGGVNAAFLGVEEEECSTSGRSIGIFRGTLAMTPFGKKISFGHRKKGKHGLAPNLCKH